MEAVIHLPPDEFSPRTCDFCLRSEIAEVETCGELLSMYATVKDELSVCEDCLEELEE